MQFKRRACFGTVRNLSWTKWAKYSVEKGSRSSLIGWRTEVSLEDIWPRSAVRTLITIMDQIKLVVQQLHNCGWIIKMIETMHFLFIDWNSPFRICLLQQSSSHQTVLCSELWSCICSCWLPFQWDTKQSLLYHHGKRLCVSNRTWSSSHFVPVYLSHIIWTTPSPKGN